MKFEIEHTYETLVEKVYKTSIEVDDEDIITHLSKSSDEIELRWAIEDYINWEIDDTLMEDGDSVGGDNEIDIKNIDQLVEYYKPLVLNKKEVSCCDNQTGNYCSVCGKKLK